MDQPVHVSKSNHHFLYCPIQIQSSHVQQYWFYQCSEKHQWQEANNPSCIIQSSEIIAMLNTMTDTPFSISNEASSKDVFGFSHLIQLISALPQIFEKSSIWKDKRSFYLLRSMERMWLMSLEISKYIGVFIVGTTLRSEYCQPEQQSTHHNDHWWSHHQLLSIGGGHLHSDDNSL